MAADRIPLTEAADRLGVHYMTAYRYVRTGRLPATRDGVQWMVDPADLDLLRSPAPRGRRGRRGRPVSRTAELADRMVAGDEPGAWRIVEGVLASGAEPADVYVDTIAAALHDIGEGWAANRLTVADEHRAAIVAHRLIGRLGPRFARPGRKRGTVVVGAAPGDHHGLPSIMLADLLRGAGFEVLDMGANPMDRSFADCARKANRLVAVGIGATTAPGDLKIRAAIRAVRDAGIAAPILVGGAAVADEEHARRLGADAWSGRDARTAVGAVESCVAGAREGVGG
ncbi:MAG TPA: B12-binding domain-containing protein [Acidimicrobiia bacterium]|nr:B12-binding domain-containing protein [Acidimicrobiia bacterium]